MGQSNCQGCFRIELSLIGEEDNKKCKVKIIACDNLNIDLDSAKKDLFKEITNIANYVFKLDKELEKNKKTNPELEEKKNEKGVDNETDNKS